MKSILYLFVAGMFLTACTSTTPTTNPPAELAPIADYKNATYLIEGSFVTLTDGFFEIESAPGSATKITTRSFGNEAIGDLNGDGKNDVAFLLTQDAGGSGTFFYVVAALQTAAEVEGTNAIFLGDRIAPQTTSIENGIITVNYADRNPGESFDIQPSLGISKYLKITDDLLVEIPPP